MTVGKLADWLGQFEDIHEVSLHDDGHGVYIFPPALEDKSYQAFVGELRWDE